METLLLEIGTEEIPAGYIEPALASMSQTLLKKMTDLRIDHGSARVFGTPRRLAVEVKESCGSNRHRCLQKFLDLRKKSALIKRADRPWRQRSLPRKWVFQSMPSR